MVFCHLALKVFVCVFPSRRVCLVAICKRSLQFVFLLNVRVSVSSWSLFIVSAGKSWTFVVLRQLGWMCLAGRL
jgi:hypothetical protein